MCIRDSRSEVTISADGDVEEALLESLMELDADGYELIDDGAVVHGTFTVLEALQDGLRQQGWTVRDWGHSWHADTSIDIADIDTSRQCLKLLDALDGLDDVRSVNTNLGEIADLETD